MAENETFVQSYQIVGWDFTRAGEASCEIKTLLKEIGTPQEIIRRIAIATYEAEMNVVMYAKRGTIRCEISPNMIRIVLEDEGPGIADINQAMQDGFSTASPEIREMGFGAGMGLPNIKRNSDDFQIASEVGIGTKLEMKFFL
ncbi:MAG: ATP-binding protein [Candidatus Zhuqueibacterota bacterium]